MLFSEKMFSVVFYEVTPEEINSIANFYTTITTLPESDVFLSILENPTDRPTFENFMNRDSFTIPGNEGKIIVHIFSKPCDILTGTFSNKQFKGCFKLKNNSDRDLLIDKYTLLEKMFLKNTFLEKKFFNYNPKSCCYPF
jgi:hypothetical protein